MRVFFLIFVSFLLIPSAFADVRFLSISDIHYGSANTFANGHDTGEELLAVALNKFSHLATQVDFIVTLGDFPTHMLRTSPKKAEYIKAVFHGLYKADQAAKPMFYIIGNNDSMHGNYQPFSWKGVSTLILAPEWHGACVYCDGLIIDGTHMREEGYYSSYVSSNNKDIMLIALNSMQFASPPLLFAKYPNQHRDAERQFHWLETQLKTHHAKHLLIAMHIPPGNDNKGRRLWHEHYLIQFIELLNSTSSQYQQISLLAGHTHMDEIRKIHLANGTNIYVYFTPSISRIHNNYPAMKIFDMDASGQLKSYTTFYTTTDKQWGDMSYHFTNTFPQCQSKTIATCLDSLNNEAVCNALENKDFYGVKSPYVDSSVCKHTYPIHYPPT